MSDDVTDSPCAGGRGDLARLINDAFIVEAFFKIGDRTSADEIVELMNAGGEFLVVGLEPTEPEPEPEPCRLRVS